MSKMTEKNSYHKKIIGKKVQARFGDNQEIVGVVNKVIDEETFLVQDMETQGLKKPL
jgi:RNase P/RNase MRP subunit p29